jgi:hypothetical protein
MRKYASTSPDSKELVDELEFVWDQVKTNVSSSNSSSPVQTHSAQGINRLESPPPAAPSFSFLNRTIRRVGGNAVTSPKKPSQDLRLSTQSPLSQSHMDETSDDDADNDEFVDAPDSQIAEPGPLNPHTPFSEDNKSTNSRQNPPQSDFHDIKDVKKNPSSKKPGNESSSRWRKRIEGALIKMTAEVAALREQMDAKSWAKAQTKRGKFEQIAWSVFSFFLKMVAVDLIVLVFVLLYLRRKKDGRLEGAIRVLLGDAVAQVQKVGSGVQRQAQKNINLVVGKMALGASSRKLTGGTKHPGGAS